MTNQNFKRILNANEYFAKFLIDIGFHKCHSGTCPDGTQAKYKFTKVITVPVPVPAAAVPIEAPSTTAVIDESTKEEGTAAEETASPVELNEQ